MAPRKTAARKRIAAAHTCMFHGETSCFTRSTGRREATGGSRDRTRAK